MKKYILFLVSAILILLVPFITLKIMNNYDYLASLDLKKFINSGNATTFIYFVTPAILSFYLSPFKNIYFLIFQILMCLFSLGIVFNISKDFKQRGIPIEVASGSIIVIFGLATTTFLLLLMYFNSKRKSK